MRKAFYQFTFNVKAIEKAISLVQKNSRILVTGGAGFIGSHIVDKLIGADAEVTVLDNLDTGKMENIAQHKQNRNFHFVNGDIRDFNLVKKILKDVDAVFNLAAIASVRLSVEDPIFVNDVNVKGTLNLLKASLDSDVRRFIQPSSAAVYGDTQTLPICEDFCPVPLSPYAVSKLATENYARVFNRVYGLKTVCLRYFNVYGPRQANSPYSGVITSVANNLLVDRPPKIFGDGNQTRDFVFVEDVVSGTILALTEKNAVGETFNIASGKAVTINQIIQMLQELMKKINLKPVYEAPREGDIRQSYANIEKAKTLLGFEPVFSIENGLKNLVAYMINSFQK
jgi:nucleoside-diphosphate-sugar epimerase